MQKRSYERYTFGFMVNMSRHLSAAKRFSRSTRVIDDRSPTELRGMEDTLVTLEDLALRESSMTYSHQHERRNPRAGETRSPS